ncbi:hypothetical protein VCSRO199_3545 [Vibrio cholerae]|uniref:hypothetical protein n=1 Tax=Vibrio cholerae TaxID=666 RepID=UPI0011598662|nr:hypothetical protein [Vibrio cholerae]TQQ68269.1 hypothetical protein FLL82_18040 [Vibrio cholerae]GHW88924.1 hypothetical protein VCSRO199_3545 [Vibrio cholerae]
MFGFQPLEQVTSLAELSSSADQYIIRVYRQSGSLHQEDRYASSKAQAISLALSTLKRARKESVRLNVNRPDKLCLHGMYNARGRQEGKKVGEVQIIAVGVTPASSNTVYPKTQTTHVRNFQPNQSQLKEKNASNSDAGMIFKGIMIFVVAMFVLCW